MIRIERVIRDRSRLHFAWERRKQMCVWYSIVIEKKDDTIDELESKIEMLEIALAKAQGARCEE